MDITAPAEKSHLRGRLRLYYGEPSEPCLLRAHTCRIRQRSHTCYIGVAAHWPTTLMAQAHTATASTPCSRAARRRTARRWNRPRRQPSPRPRTRPENTSAASASPSRAASAASAAKSTRMATRRSSSWLSLRRRTARPPRHAPPVAAPPPARRCSFDGAEARATATGSSTSRRVRRHRGPPPRFASGAARSEMRPGSFQPHRPRVELLWDRRWNGKSTCLHAGACAFAVTAACGKTEVRQSTSQNPTLSSVFEQFLLVGRLRVREIRGRPGSATGTGNLSRRRRRGDWFATSSTCLPNMPNHNSLQRNFITSRGSVPSLRSDICSTNRYPSHTPAYLDSSSAARSPRRSATGRTQPLRFIRSAYFAFCLASRPRSTASGFLSRK